MRNRVFTFVSVAIALAVCAGFTEPTGPRVFRPEAQTTTDLRILSYNIRHGQGNDDVVKLERTAETIRRLSPDIGGLPEVDDRTKRRGGGAQADELGRMLGLHAAFGKFMDYQGGGYGLAILSRFPILSSSPVRLPDGNEPRVALVAEV